LPKWKVYDEDIIMATHKGMGHAGAERVSLTLREQLYIKHLARKARRLIACCELCQKAKPINIKYDIDPQAIIRSKPNELIAVDTHGPVPISNFGHKYILVAYDVFSKHIVLYAMKSMGCLRKITHNYIPQYNAPSAILSDNASIFAIRRWREPLEELDIKVYHNSAYHPASNPSERGLRDVTTFLRVLCHKNHRTWYNALP
jgi:Integrase core domain.